MVEYMGKLLSFHSKDPTIKWRIAVSHRPIYCGWVSKSDCLVNQYLLKPFDDLYKKYSFDLLLASHEHIYERLKFYNDWQLLDVQGQMVANTMTYTNPKAAVTVICGLFGNREEFPTESSTYDINLKAVFGIQSYLDMQIDSSSLSVSLIKSADGSSLDSVKIIKLPPSNST